MPLLQIYSFLLPALGDSNNLDYLLGFSAAVHGLDFEISLSSWQALEVDSHSSLGVRDAGPGRTLCGLRVP